MKKSIQKGFTLIELMIVVAIIAILAAIAIPAYQDYTIRSKVSELIVAADACKTSVAEYYQSNGALPTALAASGCSSNATQYVASLAISGTGEIDVTAATVTALGGASGKVFALTPTAPADTSLPLSWACNGTGTTIPSKYLPASCRVAAAAGP
ncbi:pilin [Dyella sp. 20L07]|uniref:pilin n=1 Tax=Dyella sp. 20L07 TaxID=3384240 RepID=UPI003D285007